MSATMVDLLNAEIAAARAYAALFSLRGDNARSQAYTLLADTLLRVRSALRSGPVQG